MDDHDERNLIQQIGRGILIVLFAVGMWSMAAAIVWLMRQEQ